MVLYGTRGEPRRERELSRRLLERAAAETWGLSPLPETARTDRGKPYFPGLKGKEFNLSHSGGIVLCVLDAAPAGVDVQAIRAPRPATVRRALSRPEQTWLEAQPDPAAAFTALWALKESRAKQSGEGLFLPKISCLSVPLPGADGSRLLDGLWFRLGREEGAFWAVCGSSEPPEDIVWRRLV